MKQPISILPAIALRGTTILPDMIVHFDVSRERSIKAIEAAMLHDQKIFLVTQKDQSCLSCIRWERLLISSRL